MKRSSRSGDQDRSGFTLVEVIVALIILTVGVLGLAGTTALVVRQVTGAKIQTERSAALQSTIEEVRAVDYTDLADDGSQTAGSFTVSWSVTDLGTSKVVEFITVGPGLQPTTGNMTALRPTVTDTFSYRILRP